MNYRLILTGVTLILFALNTYSQLCATRFPSDFYSNPALRAGPALYGEEAADSLLPSVDLNIVLFTYDTSGIDPYLPMLTTLNNNFSEIGIEFTICEIVELDTTALDIDSREQMETLTKTYNRPNIINLYIVDTLELENIVYEGIVSSPFEQEVHLFVDMQRGSFTHQMGHIFGLFHTSEPSFGGEYSDRSNCSFSGDLVCDTEASPSLAGRLNNNCIFIPESDAAARDANNQYYSFSPTNHMAEGNNPCRRYFSKGQYKRMVEHYWMYLTHLH